MHGPPVLHIAELLRFVAVAFFLACRPALRLALEECFDGPYVARRFGAFPTFSLPFLLHAVEFLAVVLAVVEFFAVYWLMALSLMALFIAGKGCYSLALPRPLRLVCDSRCYC